MEIFGNSPAYVPLTPQLLKIPLHYPGDKCASQENLLGKYPLVPIWRVVLNSEKDDLLEPESRIMMVECVEGMHLSKRAVHTHNWNDPAKLLLVDSYYIGESVDILFSQHLFRCLGQQHTINNSGQQRIVLGRTA